MSDICANCGKEFTSTSKNQVYCSMNCKMARYKKPPAEIVTKNCKHCGSKYTTNKANKAFCSAECQRKYNKSNQRERIQKYNEYARKIGEDRKTTGDLARTLKYLDVDEFCNRFMLHYWQRSDEHERRRIEALNPDMRFA